MKRFFTFLIVVFIGMNLSVFAGTITITTAAGDNSEGTFRYAFTNAADGDVIEFNIPVSEFTDEGIIYLEGGLSRSSGSTTITINGINQATGKPIVLDIGGLASIYRGSSTASAVSLTFNQLVFRNGTNSSNGGAFSFGNSANTARATITFDGCTFENNSSPTNSGGAIGYNQWTDLIVKNCTFVNNTAGANGGAIASLSSANLSAIFTNCTFYQNQGATGGALYCHSAAATAIVNCTFVGNTASNLGGGVYADANGQTTLVNCISVGNSPEDVYGKRINLNTCIYENAGSTINTDNNPIPYNSNIFAGGTPAELKDNGGPTQTIAISQSMAYKTGIATLDGYDIPLTDQRGAPRLSPPCIGAFDNPDYVFSGLPAVKKQALTVWSEGKQIKLFTGNPGWATVYSITGNTVSKTFVSNTGTLPVSGTGIYLVRVMDNAGNAAVAKVIVQ